MEINMSEKLKNINQICEKIDDIYYQYATSFGITDTELYILYALNENDGEYLQSDICRDWSCSLQTIHSTIKNMEKKKMIELICKSENKKNKYIHLTASGKQLIDSIMLPLIKAEEKAFLSLTAKRTKYFSSATAKYTNALEANIGKITAVKK